MQQDQKMAAPASASPRTKCVRLGTATAVAALAVSSALGACSPYVFSDQTQAFSKSMASIDTSYKDSTDKMEAERQQAKRIIWIRDRPLLKRGPGCDTRTTLHPESCDLVGPNDPAEVTSFTADAPAANSKSNSKSTEDVC